MEAQFNGCSINFLKIVYSFLKFVKNGHFWSKSQFFQILEPLDMSMIEIEGSIAAQNFGHDLNFDVVVPKITSSFLKFLKNGDFRSKKSFFQNFWPLRPVYD